MQSFKIHLILDWWCSACWRSTPNSGISTPGISVWEVCEGKNPSQSVKEIIVSPMVTDAAPSKLWDLDNADDRRPSELERQVSHAVLCGDNDGSPAAVVRGISAMPLHKLHDWSRRVGSPDDKRPSRRRSDGRRSFIIQKDDQLQVSNATLAQLFDITESTTTDLSPNSTSMPPEPRRLSPRIEQLIAAVEALTAR